MSQRSVFGLIVQLTLCLVAACGGEKASSPTAPTTPVPPLTGGGNATAPPVYVVMFTHIEDNTPGGTLGSALWRGDILMGSGHQSRCDLEEPLQRPGVYLQAVRAAGRR